MCGSADAATDSSTDGPQEDSPTSTDAAADDGEAAANSDADAGEATTDATTDTNDANADDAADGPVDSPSDGPTDAFVDAPKDAPVDSPQDSSIDGPIEGSSGDGSLCGECGQGQKYCNACVSTSDVYFGCGNPDSCDPCSFPYAEAMCDGQNDCAMGACKPGFADCDGNPSNGCETDLTAHDTCGACTKACQTGEVCTSNGCAASCTFPETDCNGSCANLQTSAVHCGACQSNTSTCNDPAFGVATCASGTCAISCDSGYTDCKDIFTNHLCFDTTKDAYNCGKCQACPFNGNYSARACVSGVCNSECQPGWTMCGNTCTVLATDHANCGTCGNACTAGEICVSGQCSNVSAITLTTGLNNPGDLLIDGNTVYLVEVSANAVDSVPTSGGSVTPIATNEASPVRLAQDATYLYWSSNAGGAIRRVLKLGGSPSTLTTAVQPWGLAVDANYVYWSDNNSTLERYPLGGGSAISLGSLSKSELDLFGSTLYATNSLLYPISTPNGPVGGALYTCANGVATDGVSLYCAYNVQRSAFNGLYDHNSNGAPYGTHISGDVCGAYSSVSDKFSNSETPIYFTQRGLVGVRNDWFLPYPAAIGPAGNPAAQRVRVDGGYVYWTDNLKGALYRYPELQ